MRKKFNPKMLKWLENNSKYYTAKELIFILKDKFNEDFTLKQVQQYMFHHELEYIYECKNRSHSNLGLPIGSERTKSDGMIQVKTGPKKWEYKQRLIYEKYYNVELKSNEYVIFLDQNRNNFDINNLKVVTCQEAGYMANQKLFSKDKNITNLGIDVAKLALRTNEVKKVIGIRRNKNENKK